MHNGAERIRQIVISLRNFSRLDESEMKPVNIHEGIDSTLLILQRRLKGRPGHPDIEVIKEYGQLPLVECYPGELNQVFLNILNNAIDALEQRMKDEAKTFINDNYTNSIFTLEAYVLNISTKLLDNNRVQIKIADNGIGIEEAVINKIFDPFFTTKEVGKGTGLGLSICYQIIVEKHKGQLKCLSGSSWTTFEINIPLRQRGQL
jgi:signal transduction histidine kinase